MITGVRVISRGFSGINPNLKQLIMNAFNKNSCICSKIKIKPSKQMLQSRSLKIMNK